MISDDKTEPRRGPGEGKFTKNLRLVKTGDFRKVYKNGRSVKSGPLVLKTAANNLPISRIGFSISARSIKKASRRNRIRRTLREIFRTSADTLKAGNDLVIIVKNDPGKQFSYDDLKMWFVKAAKAARISK